MGKKADVKASVHLGVWVDEDERKLWHKVKKAHNYATLAVMLRAAVADKFSDTIKALTPTDEEKP